MIERRRSMRELAGGFGATISQISLAMEAGAENMRRTAQSMADIAADTAKHNKAVAAAAHQAAAGVSGVAATVVGLNASVQDVSRQAAVTAA